MGYQPSEKQRIFHAVKARQVLYGGAAGGGKSHAIRMDGIISCLQNPGLQAYLFRRTYPELKDNHLIPIQQMAIPPEVAIWKETDRKLTFYNDAFLQFCFAEDLADIFKYQGAEMHWLGIDEGALFLPDQLKFLRTRVRLGRYKAAQEEVFPRIVIGSNPGGPAHNLLRDIFIEQAPPMHFFHDKTTKTKNSPGWRSIYIPAKMDDNPHLDVDSYEGSFTALSPERAKALRDGDWDVVSGAALSMLDRGRHMVRSFKPPRHWTHLMAMDWGTAKPFSVGWYCISEGATLKAKDGFPDVYLPPGAKIRFAEWYGWNGEADMGARMSAGAVAREILRLEHEMELPPVDIRVADPQMWASQDGPSPQDNMRTATGGRFILRQGRRDRKANYTTIVEHLVGEQGNDGAYHPMFFVTKNCQHFWRTCPGLTLDELEPDKGPATRRQEDHCFVAGTLVQTKSNGLVPIEDIVPGDRVWTPLGWQQVLRSGCTGLEEVVEVLHDGSSFRATSSHKILTRRGWRTIDELRIGDRIMSTNSEDDPECLNRSISLARRIGFAATIGSVAASDFIAWCGSIITAPFRRGTMCTTSTETGPTTTSPTLSACPEANTSPDTCETPQGRHISRKPLQPLSWLRAIGTLAKRAASGIRSAARPTDSSKPGLVASAKSAARSSYQSIATRACARASANSAIGDAAILGISPIEGRSAVFNLSVARVPVFTIGTRGLIVHNCYDETGFALSAHSRVTTEKDRVNDELMELARELGGVVSDPYAVRRRRA